MKIKKALTIIAIISIILISNSIHVYGWTQRTYEACNIINTCMAGTIRLIAFIIAITYLTVAIRCMRNIKKENKQKLLAWLIITIIQVTVLLLGATWVTTIGIETYTYPTGERYGTYKLSEIISNAVRIIAFVSIMFYIIKSIAYFATSEEKNKAKITNLVKWQIVTGIIVAILLNIAKI